MLAMLIAVACTPAQAARRALLIGVADYRNVTKLRNPQIDVENMSTKLASAGYLISDVKDPDTTRDAILAAIDTFLNTIDRGDEVVIFYSGHGVDVNGQNMFVPIDSPAAVDINTPYLLGQKLIAMRPLMEQIEDREPAMQVWILDACRDNPYAGSSKALTEQGGLRDFGNRTNSYVFFATKYGQVARDTLPKDNLSMRLGSPFSRVFVAMFDAWKAQPVNLFASALRRGVVDLVKPDPQWPVFEDGVLDQWCFVDCSTGVTAVEVAQTRSVGLSGALASVTVSPLGGSATGAEARFGYKLKKANGVVTSTFIPASPKDAPDYSKIVGDRAVVFLGKLSSGDCNPASISDLYPFGCETLHKLVDHFSSANGDPLKGLVGQTVTLTTGVNVRNKLPQPGAKGTAYGCKVKVLTEGVQVKLAATVALSYAGDTFYWGAVDGINGPCLSAARQPAAQ
ncbi:MAG TPA: caspase family protein [Sphingomonas sp.]|nr:caspase family protein [Sphingomonas sp.]